MLYILLIFIFQILNETSTFFNSINSKTDDGNNQNANLHNNLWTPRKVSSIPYKKTDEGISHHKRILFEICQLFKQICILLHILYIA